MHMRVDRYYQNENKISKPAYFEHFCNDWKYLNLSFPLYFPD